MRRTGAGGGGGGYRRAHEKAAYIPSDLLGLPSNAQNYVPF